MIFSKQHQNQETIRITKELSLRGWRETKTPCHRNSVKKTLQNQGSDPWYQKSQCSLRPQKPWKPEEVTMAWEVRKDMPRAGNPHLKLARKGNNGAGSERSVRERLVSVLAPHHEESHPGRLCRATTKLQGVSLSWVGTPGPYVSSANQKTPRFCSPSLELWVTI